VTADFTGGEAKVDPSGLAEGKAGAPAEAGGPKAFGEGAGDAGGKSVTADFAGGDAKVDPSGLAEGKAGAPAEAGGPKSFGEGAGEAGRSVTADFAGGEAKVDPSGLAEGKVAPAEASGPKSFGEAGAGDAGRSVTADFAGGEAKVDPSGLAEGKAPADSGVQAKGAFAQTPAEGGEPKSFGEAGPGDAGKSVTADFTGGGEAKVDPSGLAEGKAGAPADAAGPKSFGEGTEGGDRSVTADFTGDEAKVDSSGLAEGKSAGDAGTTSRSSLPSEGVQAKGAFAQQGTEPAAGDAIPPKSDAPGGATSGLTEDVLPDEDRFGPRDRRPSDADPDADPDAGRGT
jgi:hypothetical protein